MDAMKVTFRILRYTPGVFDPPRFQDFELAVTPEMCVLDALEAIRLHQDSTLLYRHSCHHSSCGTCACKINGTERLLCLTRIRDLPSETVTLEPLNGFAVIGDLAVDMTAFYQHIQDEWNYLKTLTQNGAVSAETGDLFHCLEDCIECGCCVSACPVMQKTDAFMGPAALAALDVELLKFPEKVDDLLDLAGGEHGERWCDRAIACSRVCPTGVAPARHILQLRNRIQRRNAG
jgi:succinate dehydrogenase / fumarate reductase iron-sulfur subunit